MDLKTLKYYYIPFLNTFIIMKTNLSLDYGTGCSSNNLPRLNCNNLPLATILYKSDKKSSHSKLYRLAPLCNKKACGVGIYNIYYRDTSFTLTMLLRIKMTLIKLRFSTKIKNVTLKAQSSLGAHKTQTDGVPLLATLISMATNRCCHLNCQLKLKVTTCPV